LVWIKNLVDTFATAGHKHASTVKQKLYTGGIFDWKIIEETARISIPFAIHHISDSFPAFLMRARSMALILRDCVTVAKSTYLLSV